MRTEFRCVTFEPNCFKIAAIVKRIFTTEELQSFAKNNFLQRIAVFESTKTYKLYRIWYINFHETLAILESPTSDKRQIRGEFDIL